MTRCVVHGRPLRDAVLCTACVAQVTKDLTEIPAYHDELVTTMTRRSTGEPRNGSRSTTTPLPYREDASRLLHALEVWLVGWVRELRGDDPTERHGPVCDRRCVHQSCGWIRDRLWPADDTAAMSRWLYARINRIRQHLAGDEFRDHLHDLLDTARATVDRRPDLWFVGTCLEPITGPDGQETACRGELYTEVGAAAVTCAHCGTEHQVTARRQRMLLDAQDKALTAAEIAQAVSLAGGVALTATRVRKWRERGKLDVAVVDEKGRPRYRLGAVLDLLTTVEQEAS